MQGAIELINRNVDDIFIKYALHPNQNYSDPRHVPVSIDKTPTEDMDTPHYWLLLKIWSTLYQGTFYHWLLLKIWGDDYNLTFDGIRSLDGSNAGIPTLPPETGVWYFARGLKSSSCTSEADLLKALYIAALGDPKWAEPIIKGTLVDVPGVREKVSEWKDDFAGYSDEWKHLAAYNLITLGEANFRDKELVELSLLALADFYDPASPEKRVLYFALISGDLDKKGKLPGYSLIYRAGSSITARNPLPWLFRKTTDRR